MTCPECDPPERPTGPPRHETHVATRFNDHRSGFRVWLNGIEVTWRCNEAIAGEHGMVVLFDTHEITRDRLVPCACGGSIRKSVQHGRVEVQRTPPVLR